MVTALKLITAEELLAMPRGYGHSYELLRGVLLPKMAACYPQSAVISLVCFALSKHVEAKDFGGIRAGNPGYLLERDPDTVRAPDVAWIAPGRIPPGTQGYPELAPDLAVEVKSPGNSYAELAAKAGMWLSYGSREVWVADPERATITVYRPYQQPLVWGGGGHPGGRRFAAGICHSGMAAVPAAALVHRSTVSQRENPIKAG